MNQISEREGGAVGLIGQPHHGNEDEGGAQGDKFPFLFQRTPAASGPHPPRNDPDQFHRTDGGGESAQKTEKENDQNFFVIARLDEAISHPTAGVCRVTRRLAPRNDK